MRLKSATNLAWGNAEHTLVSAQCIWYQTFDETTGTGVVLNAEPWSTFFIDGDLPHIQDGWRRIVQGEFGEIAAFPEPVASQGPLEIQAAAIAAVQSALDNKARERNYDGILSLCSYAVSNVEKFALEGQAGVYWRDTAWTTMYGLLAQINDGTIPAPNSPEQARQMALDALPQMQWPAGT